LSESATEYYVAEGEQLNQESNQVHATQYTPKTRLSIVNGDITKFRTFWDSFQSAVDINPNLTGILDHDRYHDRYLKPKTHLA
jgi:hypothetical protein